MSVCKKCKNTGIAMGPATQINQTVWALIGNCSCVNGLRLRRRRDKSTRRILENEAMFAAKINSYFRVVRWSGADGGGIR